MLLVWKDKDEGPSLQEMVKEQTDRRLVHSQVAGPGKYHPERAGHLQLL